MRPNTTPVALASVDFTRSLLTRTAVAAVIVVSACASADAHHPDRENQPVHARVDVIGPLGNRLPASYRRRYNRPTNIGGKIAYWIAPTSQEAMAWHKATHQKAYECDRPRLETHYFYPKPYEALKVGPRPKPEADVARAKLNTFDNEGDANAAAEAEADLNGPAVDPLGQTQGLLEDVIDATGEGLGESGL
ncbi:hypothetical protein K227x_15860 [Rubripirellula lacrimiformis]|uniref:Lipoprotein n=1 Tax=Rubripirellula lacrimiformis TaxID=1930273 RepID=A0A517N7U0_9BACT|nr:hypothetical protein [Rubripirellula lacrimiformis]QDT03204.1 hypothetical protein K227x_15860 [Rubripirellula lacrimiformis]